MVNMMRQPLEINEIRDEGNRIEEFLFARINLRLSGDIKFSSVYAKTRLLSSDKTFGGKPYRNMTIRIG